MMNFGIGIFIIFNVGKQSLARLDPVFQKIIYEKFERKI
jgi:type IV secretory pathway TrbD component